jgi:hypothetical protein
MRCFWCWGVTLPICIWLGSDWTLGRRVSFCYQDMCTAVVLFQVANKCRSETSFIKLVSCNKFHANIFLLINTCEESRWWRLCYSSVLWRRVDSHGDTNVSEKHTVSIFRAKDGSIPNETKVVGNRSVQFLVTTVARQLFHATPCMTSNLKEWNFRLNHTFQFYETDFMQPASSVHNPPSANWKQFQRLCDVFTPCTGK